MAAMAWALLGVARLAVATYAMWADGARMPTGVELARVAAFEIGRAHV